MGGFPGGFQTARSAIISPDSGSKRARLEQAMFRAVNLENFHQIQSPDYALNGHIRSKPAPNGKWFLKNRVLAIDLRDASEWSLLNFGSEGLECRRLARGTRPSLYTCRKTYMQNLTRRSRFPSLDSLKTPSKTSPEGEDANLPRKPREKPMSTPVSGAHQPKVHVCPECGSLNLIEDFDQGETICQDCGLVLSQNLMSRGPEWRAFTKEEKDERGRVGIPTSFSIHDKGLSTVIDRVNRDAFGRQLPFETRMEMLRLRKWQIRTRVHSSSDRNLAQAMAELDRLTDRLHVPANVKEDSAVVYRKALDSGLVRGRSIAAIAAASLYAACRSSETPRTLKEVASASRIKKKDVARCYRLLLRELEMSMPVEDPIRCISKIASRAEITIQTQQSAIQVLKDARNKGVVAGKDPMGLAAAALYVACVLQREKKTQKEIAEIANVTEVTVRNRYKGLKDALGLTA